MGDVTDRIKGAFATGTKSGGTAGDMIRGWGEWMGEVGSGWGGSGVGGGGGGVTDRIKGKFFKGIKQGGV